LDLDNESKKVYPGAEVEQCFEMNLMHSIEFYQKNDEFMIFTALTELTPPGMSNSKIYILIRHQAIFWALLTRFGSA
jgi:hypothetical protein